MDKRRSRCPLPKRRKAARSPREFNFHWGGGQIVEEASYRGQHTEPAIQLLEYGGESGAYGIRFCYFNLDGRFQRSPMMIDGEDSFEGLRTALKETPQAAGDAAPARELDQPVLPTI